MHYHALLQGLFPTQGSVPGLSHRREILYCLIQQQSPFEYRVLLNSCFPGSARSVGKGIASHSSFLGFPYGSAGKEPTCNAGDLGLTPGLGRSPGGEKSYPLQDSGLENSMDCIVHRVTKSQTQLSDFHFSLPFSAYSLGLPRWH